MDGDETGNMTTLHKVTFTGSIISRGKQDINRKVKQQFCTMDFVSYCFQTKISWLTSKLSEVGREGTEGMTVTLSGTPRVIQSSTITHYYSINLIAPHCAFRACQVQSVYYTFFTLPPLQNPGR